MTVPLVILAVPALVIGVMVEPINHWLSGLLSVHWLEHWLPVLEGGPGPRGEPAGANYPVMLLGTALALAGIALAWWMYLRRPSAATVAQRDFPVLYQLSLNRFHFDELYDFFIVQPLRGFARFCRIFDLHVLDGLVDLAGHVPRLAGVLFRPMQNGLLQFYALAMLLGFTVFLIALARAYAG